MSRQSGIPNKNKSKLMRAIREEFPEYDPLMELVKIAMSIDGEQPVSIAERIACHKEVAQYVNPKLKAIEVSGDVEINHTILSKEEIIARVQAHKAAMDKAREEEDAAG